jgi:hypothetical protein
MRAQIATGVRLKEDRISLLAHNFPPPATNIWIECGSIPQKDIAESGKAALLLRISHRNLGLWLSANK